MRRVLAEPLCHAPTGSGPAARRSKPASGLPPPPEDARLTFNQVVNARPQEMPDSDFKFYKQVTDNPEFAENSWVGCSTAIGGKTSVGRRGRGECRRAD